MSNKKSIKKSQKKIFFIGKKNNLFNGLFSHIITFSQENESIKFTYLLSRGKCFIQEYSD